MALSRTGFVGKSPNHSFYAFLRRGSRFVLDFRLAHVTILPRRAMPGLCRGPGDARRWQQTALIQQKHPAYAPYETFTAFVARLKQTAVPRAIDSSILSKLSGSQRAALMSSLRFLDLIDGSGFDQPGDFG